MKGYINILLVSLLIYFLYTSCNKEAYSNKPSGDTPPDTQFYACHDYNDIDIKGKKYKTMGNNNYKVKKHGIQDNLEGRYTDLLDIYQIRKYDEVFHAPICESAYNFKGINSLDSPEILDYDDISKGREQDMLDVEQDYEKNAIKDPFSLYVNPNYIENKVTYNDNTIKIFLDSHNSTNEDNLSHRVINPLINKSTQR